MLAAEGPRDAGAMATITIAIITITIVTIAIITIATTNTCDSSSLSYRHLQTKT